MNELSAKATLTSPDGESTSIETVVPPGANPVYVALAAVAKVRREQEQGNTAPSFTGRLTGTVTPIVSKKNGAHLTLLALTPEERREVMAQFCKHCGSHDPRCQCWNDR